MATFFTGPGNECIARLFAARVSLSRRDRGTREATRQRDPRSDATEGPAKRRDRGTREATRQRDPRSDATEGPAKRGHPPETVSASLQLAGIEAATSRTERDAKTVVPPGRKDPMAHVVTCFLRHRGEVLLVRRSDAVGTYAGQWGGVSGYVEGDPVDALDDARREIEEETGIDADWSGFAPDAGLAVDTDVEADTDVDGDRPPAVGSARATLVRAGDPLDLTDGDREWTVRPFLFDVDVREVTPNLELADVEWVPPTAMLDRETVPGLWEAYRRVAPTVESVGDDAEHGSAYVSVRALEVLRDAAATADDWATVTDVARDLRDTRPSMAAIANRVNRVLATADREPRAVRDAAIEAIDRALDADDAAAATAADLLAEAPGGDGGEPTVATLSRSGTVTAALERARPDVLVAESRPAREGVGAAERLADAGLDATLTTDAALAHLLAEGDADVALVGADAVLADGSVVNKVGTMALGLAAAREGVPLYAVAARDKVRPDETFVPESGDPADLYDGEADLAVRNPTFDRTPADLVAGVATEDGLLDADDVREVAAGHRELAGWDDD
jgi:translation initiation factor 2B subunit (eIF-2B alpha/beta/delta family)